MFLILRILGGVSGLITAGLVVAGLMTVDQFVVAARQLGMDGGAVNPPQILVVLTCGLGLIGLLARPQSR